MQSDWHQEGQAQFSASGAFYRPQSQVGRDLAVLAAAIYRRQQGQLRVLDAMTGCGVRALRYHLEAGADWVWANEGNPELHDANEVFFRCYQQRDFYDLVDIDSFGGGAPYLSTGLWATRMGGLLYLTSTDTRTTGGHNPDRSVQLYGAYARAHPAVHEQGVRLLMGSAMQQAAARGFGLRPVFSLYTGQVHRVMMRLTRSDRGFTSQYGFLGYCHHCGHYQTLSWRQLGRTMCPNSAAHSHIETGPLIVSGPMWLGPLHDRSVLSSMLALAHTWHWHLRGGLLMTMLTEAEMPPYYFSLPAIGRYGQMDIPKREALINTLCDRGYAACRTHFDAQAIKTTATMADCIAAAKALV